ncbi:MAG: substrate-binding domain-containing protein [Halanaerobiales bacterium]|nr:substrate-binding domain-containing protein [Halanaerobiales bacterium]
MRKFLSILIITLLICTLGGTISSLAENSVDFVNDGDTREDLAQRYKNAEPGEEFLVGHITFQLAQEYAMMMFQSTEQAAEQLGLKFKGVVAHSDAEWIQLTKSMIASGAKAITYNCPSLNVVPELARICEENDVFMLTNFGITGEMLPGDYGPRWVVDNSPQADEQAYFPLMLLFEKMSQDGKTRVYHQQGSKSSATVAQVQINLATLMAWSQYPELKMYGHQYGEWNFEDGRKGAEAALAERTDYQGIWAANDSQITGALSAFQDRGIFIDKYAVSRDMETTTAQKIVADQFLATNGFDIPYFGGRMVAMAYDMCVGKWYPMPDEMVQAGKLNTYGNSEAPQLAKDAGISDNPSFYLGPTEKTLNKILMEIKKDEPQYPYDFRLVSHAKTEELGLEYDRHAGGGTELGFNDFYYPVKTDRFASRQEFKNHIGALHEYLLDLDVETWEEAKKLLESLPSEIKTEPVWN